MVVLPSLEHPLKTGGATIFDGFGQSLAGNCLVRSIVVSLALLSKGRTASVLSRNSLVLQQHQL